MEAAVLPGSIVIQYGAHESQLVGVEDGVPEAEVYLPMALSPAPSLNVHSLDAMGGLTSNQRLCMVCTLDTGSNTKLGFSV